MSDNPYEMIHESPPSGQRGRGGHGRFAPWLDAMRAEPNEWFKFPEPVTGSSYQSAYSYRKVDGKRVYEPRFRVDLTLPKDNGRKMGWLYCRYVGEPD